MWLFLAFLAVPLIEIALFVQVGGAIGLWPTLAIVVLTAVAGTWLVRAQGAMAVSRLRQSFSELDDPTEPLVHGAMILVAGVLLLTPGFFTDGLGFALLVPPVRHWAFNFLRQRVRVQKFEMGSDAVHTYRAGQRGSETIDGEYREVDPSNNHSQPPSGWTKH